MEEFTQRLQNVAFKLKKQLSELDSCFFVIRLGL